MKLPKSLSWRGFCEPEERCPQPSCALLFWPSCSFGDSGRLFRLRPTSKYLFAGNQHTSLGTFVLVSHEAAVAKKPSISSWLQSCAPVLSVSLKAEEWLIQVPATSEDSGVTYPPKRPKCRANELEKESEGSGSPTEIIARDIGPPLERSVFVSRRRL